MDNFIVSARKYRPVTFESVVGQSHITSTLRNAISRGQLAHAYLFTGPRGVGKTTCARIFAKSINCLNPQGSEACGECESCRAFNENRSFNIHELDAASNNSVDDIRSLTEQVRIPPQIGRYSVYIIDEVHMLSQAAFNAFLKTLEEPPAHAIFVLATTEKHKIIPTILSRCQIYDFNRIRVEDGVSYLKYIAGHEEITYDDESLNLIAAKADGGMRDALSMFDKAVAFCGKSLNFKEVARTLNVLDYDTYFNVTRLAAAGDYKSVLLIFDDILRKGFSAQTFVGGLAAHIRDLLMCRDAATIPLLEATGTLLERYKEQSAQLDTGYLFEAMSLINSTDATLRTATNSRLHVELGLMKLCSPGQKKNNLEPSELQLPILDNGGQTNVIVSAVSESAPISVVGGVSDSVNAVTLQPTAEQHAAPTSIVIPQQPVIEQSNISDTEHHDASNASTLVQNKTDIYDKVHAAATRVSASSTQPRRGASTISGVSISNILKGGGMKGNPGESAEAIVSRPSVDPDSQSKIESVRAEFLAELGKNRPRIATALSDMRVNGNKISATVATDLLREDIIQNQKELLLLFRDLCDLQGMIEFDINVKEDKGAVKPIKAEDKLAYLRSKNPALDDLRRELGLEIE